MTIKAVVVHTCRHAEMDDGSDFDCRCAKHVTVNNALQLIASGEAYFKRAPLGAVDSRQIILTGRTPQLPRAATITSVKWWENLEHDRAPEIEARDGNAADRAGSGPRMRGHIERAYVAGDRREQERIEAYGAMQRETWRTVGAPSGKVHGKYPTTR